jgi:hypothetical protein
MNTVHLGGIEADDSMRLAMAKRLIAAAAAGERTVLSLAGAALGWRCTGTAS